MVRFSALLLCAVLAWGQRPVDADSAALIERSRQKALDYTNSLPDFICSEEIHRYTAPAEGVWTLSDTLTVKLGYSRQMEMHKLELIDGKPTDRSFDDLGGATSSGEFGGVLRTIFDPASKTAFDWSSSRAVRNRRAAVYHYTVAAANSPYYVEHKKQVGIVGLHGTVTVDHESGEVIALNYIAYDIPKQLELQSLIGSVEYDLATVGGGTRLLPARSEMEMHASELWTRNKTEFRDYRKFSADSSIEFGPVK